MRIVGIQPGPQVADLGGDPVSAAVDAAVDHQGPADAAADVGIEDHAMAAAGPEEGLGQAGGIGIVGERRPASPNVSRHQSTSAKSVQPST